MADHKYLKKQIDRLYPELTGGLHLDRYGRVLALSDAPTIGASSERFRPRYAVDIEILTPDLEPDAAFPKYTAVPLPVPAGAGGEAGTFAFPHPGTLVVVGFAYGRQDHPIIRQIYPMGDSLPEVKPDELLLQRSPDVYQRADENGNWTRQSSAAIVDDSVERQIKAVTSVKEVCSDTTKVSEHQKTEVDGMASLEVGTQLTLLAGTRADLGTLGQLNLTAGGSSTHTTGKDAVETVGGSHQSEVKKDRSVTIKGARDEYIGKDQELKVGGDHTDTATGDRLIQAQNIVLKAKQKFTIISEDGSSSVNFFDELLTCLADLRKGLDVLANHDHPDAGTINQGAAVASHAASAEGHRQNMQGITE